MSDTPLRNLPAWIALGAHHKAIENTHLSQLFAEDAKRGERLAVEDVGIYLDEWTSGVTATNNIVVGGNLGFELHGGSNDVLTNNIFDIGPNTTGSADGLIQSNPGGAFAFMTVRGVRARAHNVSATGHPNLQMVAQMEFLLRATVELQHDLSSLDVHARDLHRIAGVEDGPLQPQRIR